jgi:uncharacterized 2Fe-2S/4Fe-4S cluster protein (DUF4445 family)
VGILRIQTDPEKPCQELRVTPAHERQNLAELLRREGHPLNTRCGQKGVCEGCLVELHKGRLFCCHDESEIHSNGEFTTLKACLYRVGAGEEAHLRIPARSLLAYHPQVQTDYRINIPCGFDPIWKGPAASGVLPIGAAIDVGTTTVVVMLLDLGTGQVLARSADFNQQFRYGDDVLTRIALCSTEGMLGELQRALVERTIAPLLREAFSQLPPDQRAPSLVCTTVAGNTTMLHLLAGIDPTPMGVVPFTPAFLHHRVLATSELPGWPVELGSGEVHLLPGASAYVGSDLAAGAVASGLLYDEGPSLLVDVGTNGEILFKHGHRLLGCATAAGPAFEGAGLACGMRAGDGAISHITLERRPFRIGFEHIGQPHATLIGLCGSAYIDFLGQARRIGLLTMTGRFAPDAVPDASGRFIEGHPGDKAFRIASSKGHDLVVAESDIASLLAAKAAIAAGITVLLSRAGVQPSDIKRVYLAGGFGTHMRVENAIACGLLPDFAPEQIQPVGNTALAGAYISLLDRGALAEIDRVRRSIEVIELNTDPNFEMTYIEHLCLPAPDDQTRATS